MTNYISAYSGEEIDAAVTYVQTLAEEMTANELLAKIASLEERITALEGGGE